MKIAEASARSGISIDTLRFYEKEGLISPARSSGQRVFTEADLDELDTIARLRRLGISISEVRILLEIDRTIGDLHVISDVGAPKLQQVQSILSSHAERIEAQIAEMQATLTAFRKMTSKLSELQESGGLGDDH